MNKFKFNIRLYLNQHLLSVKNDYIHMESVHYINIVKNLFISFFSKFGCYIFRFLRNVLLHRSFYNTKSLYDKKISCISLVEKNHFMSKFAFIIFILLRNFFLIFFLLILCFKNLILMCDFI